MWLVLEEGVPLVEAGEVAEHEIYQCREEIDVDGVVARAAEPAAGLDLGLGLGPVVEVGLAVVEDHLDRVGPAQLVLRDRDGDEEVRGTELVVDGLAVQEVAHHGAVVVVHVDVLFAHCLERGVDVVFGHVLELLVGVDLRVEGLQPEEVLAA